MMRHAAYFVTGTDTGVGKTLITCALIHSGNKKGVRTLGIKPVASGCQQDHAGAWHSDDALQILGAMSMKRTYADINPCALEYPVSPHIAAAAMGVHINIPALAAHCRHVVSPDVDFALVEGVGGWLAPLSEDETLEDLAKAIGFPVIMVVGIRLGCLSTALLTADRIRQSGLILAGWIGSVLDPAMHSLVENIHTLKARLGAPCLGVVPFVENITPHEAEPYLDISCIK